MTKAQRIKVKKIASIVLFALAAACLAGSVVLDVITLMGESINQSFDQRYDSFLSNGVIGAAVMGGVVFAVISLLVRVDKWVLIADIVTLILLIAALVVPIVA